MSIRCRVCDMKLGEHDWEDIKRCVLAEQAARSTSLQTPDGVELVSQIHGQIECKRLYLPGASLKARCPKCNEIVERTYKSEYLGYPVMNKPFSEHMYCDACEYEWSVRLELKVELVLPNPD